MSPAKRAFSEGGRPVRLSWRATGEARPGEIGATGDIDVTTPSEVVRQGSLYVMDR
jgi:hypothetical protein